MVLSSWSLPGGEIALNSWLLILAYSIQLPTFRQQLHFHTVSLVLSLISLKLLKKLINIFNKSVNGRICL